jgi:hypothetical protein
MNRRRLLSSVPVRSAKRGVSDELYTDSYVCLRLKNYSLDYHIMDYKKPSDLACDP